MKKRLILAVAAAAVLGSLPAFAQAPPFAEATPTKKEPLRFEAFAVNMQGGMATRVEIVIERWSTEDERAAAIRLVQSTTDRPESQRKLVDALENVKERVGFIRGANTLGYDLKYAHENQLPDGSRQIVIATDKPVSFLAAARGSRTMDYLVTLIEMRFPAGADKGEGKLLGQSAISTKDGKLTIELYGQEPTRLTTITEKNPKVKK